ncbi:MAG: response regulator [Pseudomonadota bacterium]
MSEPQSTILIVDDQPANIRILGEALMGHHTVVAATDGFTALELAARDDRPDLILLDVLMAGMDGFEVCERLKAQENTAGIPVIFITELSDESNEERGLSIGAVDYMYKPVNPAIVRARVNIHLELKRHRDFLELMLEKRTHDLATAQREALARLEDITPN